MIHVGGVRYKGGSTSRGGGTRKSGQYVQRGHMQDGGGDPLSPLIPGNMAPVICKWPAKAETFAYNDNYSETLFGS